MHWTIAIQDSQKVDGNQSIKLGLKDEQEVVWVTEEYASLQNWKQEVLRLKADLENILEQGEINWKNREKVDLNNQLTQEIQNPEEVWSQMQEFADEQEMSSFFNQLGEETRKKTAEYVFTQVSMFKGYAPYFAQNHDYQSNKLVK